MTTIGAYEAKTHFSKLIERVARGERITVTRHGVPVMTIQPVGTHPKMPPEDVIAAIKAFRKGKRLEERSIREMIEEGRL
ncbi:MAG: type II toxin-antitoxin system prevent-host-death family antitoxin [Anaerolineales bacterium]|jgi:prevent-host-death family protein